LERVVDAGALQKQALAMWLVAGASLLGLLAVAAASPERLAELVRGGEPMPPIDVSRLTFLRAALGLVGVGVLVHAFVQRRTTSWRPFHQLLFATSLLGVGIVIAYKMRFGVRDAKYIWFVREDGVVEYATALVFLVAAAVAFLARSHARDSQTKIFLILLALATTFVGLSEVSFGQRIFGIETPEALAAINRQDETTIHNIEGVEAFVMRVMPLLLLAYALLGGVAARMLAASPLRQFLSTDLLRVAPVPWYGAGYFIPIALYSIKAMINPDDVWQDQEPSELWLSIGFLILAAHAALALRNQPHRARAREPMARSRRTDPVLR
jgi:uncharacterized membrane protein SirB2